MNTTLNREQQSAIEHFEHKLAFEIGPIGLKYAKEAGEKLQIVDLRTPEFFAKGHVPGAVNIDIDNLEKESSNWNKDVTAVVYCYNITCHLATKAALLLAKKGVKVKELVGGFDEYVKAELPTEKQGSHCGCG